MAYDEGLAQRLREEFAVRDDVIEKKMFGGLCFMLAGNMCCGIVKETLMARVGPDQYADALKREHAREMDFTGKALKGMIYVDPIGVAEDQDLQEWVKLCLNFTQSLPPK